MKNYYYRVTEYLSKNDKVISSNVWSDKVYTISEARKLLGDCWEYNLDLWKTESFRERKNKTLDIEISKWIVDENGNWLDFNTVHINRYDLETLQKINVI